MGAGGSKPKMTSVIREIDQKINAEFTANCNTSAQSIQEIEINNMNIIMEEGCRMAFINRATVNSFCDMGPIIDAIAEKAVDENQEFAKTIQDAQDRVANAKCKADNCKDKIKVAVTKKLTSNCESSAKAQQTLRLNGATIICNGNTVAKFGNYSEVRATCIRSLLHGGLEEMSKNDTGEFESPSSPPPSYSSKYSESYMMIMFALAFFAIIILTKKKSGNTNENG